MSFIKIIPATKLLATVEPSTYAAYTCPLGAYNCLLAGRGARAQFAESMVGEASIICRRVEGIDAFDGAIEVAGGHDDRRCPICP